ncbi:hypothetical protein GCM10023322_40180 [Rugosimonospora acidiphila]|uniref:Uncharacterized protein n=1 Tax=Rugosimonospora acidiphila TaxID=556531 RepID=A0ABP9RXN8_9ACTN
MNRIANRRRLSSAALLIRPKCRLTKAFPLAAALLLLVTIAWQVAHSARATADVTQTTAVSAGPATFTQQAPAGNPSDYGSQLERCSHGVDYPLSGANPILSEPLTTAFTSNVPLSAQVAFNGNQWYGTYQLTFTNKSSKPLNVDCAVIIFRGPSHADQHYYFNQEATGHPQSDYLEVPRGDGTSFYIVRLGFHDVAAAQQTGYPNETFAWQIGAAPAAALTLEQLRDSIRFTADLNLSSNTSLIQHYGTNRLAN